MTKNVFRQTAHHSINSVDYYRFTALYCFWHTDTGFALDPDTNTTVKKIIAGCLDRRTLAGAHSTVSMAQALMGVWRITDLTAAPELARGRLLTAMNPADGSGAMKANTIEQTTAHDILVAMFNVRPLVLFVVLRAA